MRSISVVALVLLPSLCASWAEAQCIIDRNTSVPGARLYVFAGSLWQQSMKDLVSQAAAQWSGAISDAGGGADQVSEVSSNGNLEIYIDPALGEGDWGVWSGDTIWLNPDIFSESQGFALSIILHEFGHSIGYSHLDSGCDSIMRLGQSPSSYVGGLTSNDYSGVHDDYDPGWCGDPDTCSPIVFDLGQAGVRLTSPSVWFDITGTGRLDFIGWTDIIAEDGFLALDRDGDGIIRDGRELFGNATPLSWTLLGPKATHGFTALRYFDEPASGGNGDGWIDRQDDVYAHLRVWRDTNQDGVSQPEELEGLSTAGIVGIDLAFRASQKRDAHGNVYRYRGRYLAANDGKLRQRALWDVFFVGGTERE